MSYLGVAVILGVKFMRTFRENKVIFIPNAIKNKDKKNSLFSLKFHIDQTFPEEVKRFSKILALQLL